MGLITQRSPRKSNRDTPDVDDHIFDSNVKNTGDSLLKRNTEQSMIRRKGKEKRPLLRKIDDVNEIVSVKDSEESEESEESIVLDRANTPKLSIPRIGGSMLNISKTLSSPSLKSNLLSMQTHQSSVSKHTNYNPRKIKGLLWVESFSDIHFCMLGIHSATKLLVTELEQALFFERVETAINYDW